MEAKHKFELILTALRNEIQSGTYPSGGRFPSEYELADRFGVNKMTANKAVSQLVYEGYLQRGGRGSNTKVIMTEKIPKGYFAYVASLVHEANCQFLTGIENYAFAHGYSVIFLAPPVDALASCISRLQHPDIVGIMTTSYGILDVPGKNVLHLGLALPESDRIHHAICSDFYDAGAKMLQKLLDKGHREILLYNYSFSVSCATPLWLAGAKNAMLTAGIHDFEDRVVTCMEYEEIELYTVLKKMLARYPQTTAIAAISDNDAVMIMNVLKRLRIPPGKICVTGGGRLTAVEQLQPLPTTYHSRLSLARTGCEFLVEMAKNGAPAEPVRQIVEVDLIHTELIPEIRQ